MGKKRYYKDGNPEVYRDFNDVTWKNMTDREKAMWTPYSDVEQAPIPQEVIDFQEKQQEEPVQEVEEPVGKAAETEKVELTEEQQIKLLKEELRKKGIRFAPNSKLETLQKKLDDAND